MRYYVRTNGTIELRVCDTQEFEEEIEKQYNAIVTLNYTPKQVEERLDELMEQITKLWALESAYKKI